VAGAVAQEGNLIVHKQVLSEYPDVYASGENFTVTIDVYNIGDGSAFDVSVTDNWPETTSSGTEAFKLVDGSYTSTWGEIVTGEHVSANFTIVPMFEGRFDGSRASGRYEPKQDAETKIVISTAMRPMSVLNTEQYTKYFAKQYQEWAIFYLCSLATIFVPLFIYGYIQTAYTNGIPNAPIKED